MFHSYRSHRETIPMVPERKNQKGKQKLSRVHITLVKIVYQLNHIEKWFLRDLILCFAAVAYEWIPMSLRACETKDFQQMNPSSYAQIVLNYENIKLTYAAFQNC